MGCVHSSTMAFDYPPWNCGNVPHAKLLVVKSYEGIQDIGHIILSWTIMKGNVGIIDTIPNEMIVVLNMLHASTKHWVVSNGYSWQTVTAANRCGNILLRRSYMRSLSHIHPVVAAFAALYSASLDEMKFLSCFLFCHEIEVLPLKKIYPEVDL